MAGFDLGKIAKGVLGTVAPLIGTAIGGPFGGVAAKIAMDALGIDEADPNSHDQLEARIANPSASDVIALRTADQAFKTKMRELNIKEEELHAGDRGNARDMAKKTGIWPQVILSVIYTVAYGVVLYCFMTGKLNVPEDQKILFGSLIGILTGAQVQILNFWFGSSAGSKEKTAAMASK